MKAVAAAPWYTGRMSSNTRRLHHPERRKAARVRVLFSAVLSLKGWRSQIVEVVDLSEAGAKVECRFPVKPGAHVSLRIPGPSGRLGVPAVVVNGGESHGHPTAGLRFDLEPAMRDSLREIVERVERMRSRNDAVPRRGDTTRSHKPPARPGDTRRRRRGSAPGASL
jgi:hypothetical protein